MKPGTVVHVASGSVPGASRSSRGPAHALPDKRRGRTAEELYNPYPAVLGTDKAATLIAYAVSFPFSKSKATVEYISAPPPQGTL